MARPEPDRNDARGLLWLELRANLAARILGAVHVDVEIALRVGVVLGVGELRSCRRLEDVVGGLVEGNDDRAVVPVAPSWMWAAVAVIRSR
jgi:hypothetical protein